MAEPVNNPRMLGRYALYDEIAAGGMATVHLARLVAAGGFSRTVAVKRLHPQFAKDPEFAAMFLDEARLVARIQHPNVVSTLDVVQTPDELFLVMDYIQGESLSQLHRAAAKKGLKVPFEIASAIISAALFGLHAAHTATSEKGEPLQIVHRDVSPQNIMVGVDGVARVLDFGVAKAASRSQQTREGQIKGKLQYMAPEQIEGESDARTDLYAMSIVLWELLAGRRLFDARNEGQLVAMVMAGCSTPPSAANPEVPEALDKVVMWGLEKDPAKRAQTARELAIAIEKAVRPATQREVHEWVLELAGDRIGERQRRVAEIESISASVSIADEEDAPTRVAGLEKSGATAVPSLPIAPAAGGPPEPRSGMSAVTGITGTGDVRTDAPPQGKGKLIVAGVLALAALGAVAGVAVLSRSGDHAGAQPTPSAPANAASSQPDPVQTSAQPAAPPAPPTADVTAAPPSSASAPPPSASAKAKGKDAGAKGKPDAPAKPKVNCSPPYTVGADGEKRYKPECL